MIMIIIPRVLRCCPCVGYTPGKALLPPGSHLVSVGVAQDLLSWAQGPDVEKQGQRGAAGLLSKLPAWGRGPGVCLWLWFTAPRQWLPAFSRGPQVCSGPSRDWLRLSLSLSSLKVKAAHGS